MIEAEARTDDRIHTFDPNASQRSASPSPKSRPHASETAEPGTEDAVSVEPSPRASLADQLIKPTVVGGLAGALFAITTVFALNTLQPPLDPRVPALAQQVAGFQQEMYALETAVRASEVDVVRALETDGELASRIDGQDASLAAALQEIAEAGAALQVESGPGSVVFGVSVVQFASAIDAGQPFENEWVNLHALTSGHEELRAQLATLMPFATAGVATYAELRTDLREVAARAGTPVLDPNDYIAYGMDVIQTGLGIPLGTTPEGQVQSAIVTDAHRELGSGEISRAIEILETLPNNGLAPFRAWMIQAKRKETADTVVDTFKALASSALQARATKSADRQQ